MTKGTLYVVAAPIGNAGDITERAKKILTEVDIIAAEDTRSAGLLLKAIGVSNKLISYHKFNEKQREDYIIAILENGRDAAIISDAGTPCISDPGGLIVRAAVNRGIRATSICGPSAITAALSICGYQFNSFAFYGFLPRSEKSLRKLIKETCMNRVRVVGGGGDVGVFFESPKRVKKSLGIFEEEAPYISLCLCNDLTKKHERIYRGTPRQVLEELMDNPSAEKGEYTLVVAFPQRAGIEEATALSISPEAALVDYLINQNGSIKDAVGILSRNRLYKRNVLYEAANNLKRMFLPQGDCGEQDRVANTEKNEIDDIYFKAQSRIKLRTVVIDCSDEKEIADFYSMLLGWNISKVEDGWILLRDPQGGTGFSFQREEKYSPPVWPEDLIAQAKMMHLDFVVSDLDAAVSHALSCGAILSREQFIDGVKVLFDPAGHPFCLFADKNYDWESV